MNNKILPNNTCGIYTVSCLMSFVTCLPREPFDSLYTLYHDVDDIYICIMAA